MRRGAIEFHILNYPTTMARILDRPGWVSVLLAMKAAVDFGVDLRNHDARRSWSQGYADN